MPRKPPTAPVLIVLALLFSVSMAHGQRAQDPIYAFDDDPLQGGVLDGQVARIRVNPQPKRVMLLRPRVSYVPELLKSVEGLGL
jgi:hypothetical protein